MKVSSLILILLLAIVVIAFLAWTRLPDTVATHLSKKMKVSVEIDDIALSRNSIAIAKLDIGNPKGSILNTAFTSNEIRILAPLGHYFDKQIEIDEIAIDKIYLGLEFNAPGSKEGNWTTIMQNFRENSGSGSDRIILIKKLILTNISIDLAYRSDGGKTTSLKPIDRLEFTNVTSEGGVPSDQIANAILIQTLRSIFQKEHLQDMLENVIPSTEGSVDKLTQPFKNLFNAVEQEIDELLTA